MSSGPPSDGGRNHSGGAGLGGPFSASPSASAHNCPTVVGVCSPEKPKRRSTRRVRSMRSRLSSPRSSSGVSASCSPSASGRRSNSARISATAAFVVDPDAAHVRLGRRRKRRELAGARAEQEVVRHVHRRFRPLGDVPGFEPRVQRLTPQSRQFLAGDAPERNVDFPARHQHEQVGKQPAGADKQTADQRRLAPGEGVAEPAAPQAARPHQDGRGLWNGLEDVSDGSCGAEAFQAAAPQSPRRPDDVVAPGLQASDHVGDRLLGLRPRSALASWRTGTSTASSSFMNGKRRGLRKLAP